MKENPVLNLSTIHKSTSKFRRLPYLLAGIPILMVIYLVVNYSVDIPFRDQWFYVPILGKSYSGTLELQDLWKLHNEHRILFPRLIMLVLARLSHWNITIEMGMNILLSFVSLSSLLILVRQMRKRTGMGGTNWLIPITSLFVFSLTQWQNWLWGWQISFFLVISSLFFGVTLLSKTDLTWPSYFYAATMGLIATYSFGNGFLYWISGLFVLIAKHHEKEKNSVSRIYLWISMTIISIVIYLIDYHHPSHHPTIWVFKDQLGEVFKYTLTFLGNPINGPNALVFGGIGLVVFILLSVHLLRTNPLFGSTIAAFTSLGIFSILSAILIGAGRVWLGPSQALDSRYVTFSFPMWFSNIIFLVLYFHLQNSKKEQIPSTKPFAMPKREIIAFPIIIILLLLILINNVSSIPRFSREYQLRAEARQELFVLGDMKIINVIHPELELLETHLEVLIRYRLSAYRQMQR